MMIDAPEPSGRSVAVVPLGAARRSRGAAHCAPACAREGIAAEMAYRGNMKKRLEPGAMQQAQPMR